MKKVVIVSLLLISSFSGYSQTTENDEKRFGYGISVGFNYSNMVLLNPESRPNGFISNNPGFRMGISGSYRISELFAISQGAELSFENSIYTLYTGAISFVEYEMSPVNIDLITHFVYKMKGEKLTPYLLIGPNFKIPISQDDGFSRLSPPGGFFFSIDFGIGVEKPFQRFNIAPELRYSLGISEGNDIPWVPLTKFHNVAMVFNFLE